MSNEIVMNLFKFRPVIIGTPMNIHGGSFRFHYALHTIPTLGFDVSFGNKSIFFSGNTFYYPKKLKKLFKKGLITQRRYEIVAKRRWDYDLILHEVGKSFHTPIKILDALPEEVKKKMYLLYAKKE